MRIACYVTLVAFCLALLTACRFPGSTQPTVKIGLVAPFEGRYRYVGYDVIYAVRLALREANAAGGVRGYSVELTAYDDGADPTQAVAQARKLAVDPAVVAAIGHFGAGTTDAALPTYAEANIPLIVPAVLYSPLAGEQGQVRHTGPRAETVAGEMFVKLHGLGEHQAALVTAGSALGKALKWAEQQHRSWVAPVVSPQETDWLEQVLDSGVKVVFCDTDPVTAGETIVALRQAGWEGAFLGGPELAASDFAAVAGKAATGTMFITPYPLQPDGAYFIAAYQNISNGVQPGSLALPAYRATQSLLEALERDIAAHGHPTREGTGVELVGLERAWSQFYWYRIEADGAAHLTATTR